MRALTDSDIKIVKNLGALRGSDVILNFNEALICLNEANRAVGDESGENKPLPLSEHWTQEQLWAHYGAGLSSSSDGVYYRNHSVINQFWAAYDSGEIIARAQIKNALYKAAINGDPKAKIELDRMKANKI